MYRTFATQLIPGIRSLCFFTLRDAVFLKGTNQNQTHCPSKAWDKENWAYRSVNHRRWILGGTLVISDTKNEWCYGVTVNIRSDMFMILQGEISKRSSNLNCRREAISQRDAFSIYETMMYKRGNGRARCGNFCLRHVARVPVSGTMFVGQMAWIRDLGKGAKAITYLKTVPIMTQGKVNVKVIYLLETEMALGDNL